MPESAKNGRLVPIHQKCVFCGREPRDGEIYGTGPKHWDHAEICPECWAATFKEDD